MFKKLSRSLKIYTQNMIKNMFLQVNAKSLELKTCKLLYYIYINIYTVCLKQLLGPILGLEMISIRLAND